MEMFAEALEPRCLLAVTPSLTRSFEGLSIDTDLTDSSIPDTNAAAGPSHVVTVKNHDVVFYTKAGTQLYHTTLQDFFQATTFTDTDGTQYRERLFDPRVVYDQYADRFLISAAGRTEKVGPNATQILLDSHLYVAVSDDGAPTGLSDAPTPTSAGKWNRLMISTFSLFSAPTFEDFPNLATGTDAIYLSATPSSYLNLDPPAEPQLWIIEKSSLYDNSEATTPRYTRHEPRVASGASNMNAVALFPSQMFGTPPAGVGTYLMARGNDNSTNADTETDVVHVLRVSDPLGAPNFTRFVVPLGIGVIGRRVDPPPGKSTSIELLNATFNPEPVWRNGALWATETMPQGIKFADDTANPEAGEVSVHWVKINTSTMTVAEQGFIGGEEIASGTRTGYGSIAVNAAGDAAIGFSAAGPNVYAGAYYTMKTAGEAAFRAPNTLAAEENAPYFPNSTGVRWADYTATVVDPNDDRRFWTYNMYAMEPAVTPLGTPRYRWGTRVGAFSVPHVARRTIFYNDSTFDGHDGSANAADDAAIATNKTALLPGQTATLSNYSSNSRGINGVMVNINRLGSPGSVSVADFSFQVGNDANPTAWATAPAPTSVAVRQVIVDNDVEDRISFVWSNGAIVNQWLRVTVKANSNTGLKSPDIFYFGNLIGESDIDYNAGYVNAYDSAKTRQSFTSSATVENLYDHNHDAAVDMLDVDVVTANLGRSIILLVAPAT